MVFGVDGCKGGWFFVGMRDSGVSFGVVRRLHELREETCPGDLVLIDIPIGLPHSPGERRCDLEARKALSPRGSCVFPVPCREALDACDYASACAVNHRVVGKKLSKQTWAICPKIREVDQELRLGVTGRAEVRETHPEVCFWALNGKRPVLSSKTTEEGAGQRLALLQRAYPRSRELLERAAAKCRKDGVCRDDILDALVAAVTASCRLGDLAALPMIPERDAVGLPMEIVYPEVQP